MSKTRKVALCGVGIALYVVVSMIANIPLVGIIRLDCGYIVYGIYLALFGWLAIPVGVVGCFIKGYVSDGWIPFTWMIGQTIIGISCAYAFKKTKNMIIRIIVIVVSVFLGIAIVSSGLSAIMFNLPMGVKIFKGSIASIADSVGMIVGLLVSKRLEPLVKGVKDE